MDIARYRKNAITAYVVYVILFCAILIFKIEPFLTYGSTFGLIGNLLAFPMYWLGLKIHQGDRRWPWVWFAATGVLYFMGDLLWAYNEDFLGAAPESPSICDLFYLLNSYTCCCAFICYIRQIKNIDSASTFFDVFVSVIAAGGLMYRFILRPLIDDASIGLFPMFFHANMSVIDLTLFSGILVVIFGTASGCFYTKRTLLLGLSFFACCFVEQLSLAMEVYELPIGSFFDPFWAAPFWLFALTATYPDEDETDEEEVMVLHRRWGKSIKWLQRILPYFLTGLILVCVGFGEALENVVFAFVLFLMAARLVKYAIICMRRRSACTS